MWKERILKAIQWNINDVQNIFHMKEGKASIFDRRDKLRNS